MKSGALRLAVVATHRSLRGPTPSRPRAAVRERSTARASTAARTQRNKEFGQARSVRSASDDDGGPSAILLPDVPPWTEIEQLNFEKETLGLYWSGHPIDRYAEDLRAYGARTTRDLTEARDGGDRRVGDAVADERGQWRCRAGGRVASGAARPRGRSPKTFRSAASSRVCARSRRARAIGCASSCSTTRRAASRSWSSRRHSSSTDIWRKTARWSVWHGRFERDDESARIIASEIVADRAVRERLTKSVAITAVNAAARSRDVRKAAGTSSPSTKATGTLPSRHCSEPATAHARDG